MRRAVIVLGAAALLVVVLVLVLPRGDAYGCTEFDQWPGRPNCEPVGTTITIRLDCDPPELGCYQTRWVDEVGESPWKEIAIP